MTIRLRLSIALFAVLGVVCSKTGRAPDASQDHRQAAITNPRTSDTSSEVDQRILDEMRRRGVTRDAAIGHLIRIAITQAVPDSKDPLGLLTADDEFIESGIQRYMKQNNVSRSEAVQRLLHIAATTDPANPLGLEPPPGAKR